MEHTHSHGHITRNITRAFVWGIGLNISFTLIEFILGYYYNSLALIADASHNLSDVASLILSLIGFRLAQKAASKLYTYGYKKSTILASLINSVVLVFIVIGILREAIERLNTLPEVGGIGIIITAGIGIIINTVSAFLFFKNQKNDINIRGAFIHLLVDALVSVGVVISGIIILYTNIKVIDPIISIIIALIIALTTWNILKESLRLIIDAVPKDINYNKIESIVNTIPEVINVHHMHIWAISSNINGLTAHIIVDKSNFQKIEIIKREIKNILSENNIQHSTLEFEFSDEECMTENCH
ncbi:MAG: cation transporter [Bacteroidales bacterium]|nr:cation transporter [Bacteroidales bacterium]